MEAAANWKKRSVVELYNSTKMIVQPEITPISRGIYQMQGPIDEMDNNNQKYMAERRFGKRSMNRKGRTRAESGTCNVCSAPCSSCMHLDPGLMGSKSDEVSDKTCRVTVGSQFSANGDAVLPSFKVRASDSVQNTSEASNLASVNSSHDSFSENAESKATFRSSDASDALEGVDMLPKLSSGGTGAENKLPLVPASVLDQRVFSDKFESSKSVEGHGDNISCVSRANDACLEVGYKENVGSKNSLQSSAAVTGLISDGSAKELLSRNLDLSEVPPLREDSAGGSSPKLQNAFYQPQCVNFPGGENSGVLISEAENNKNSGDTSNKAFKCSGQDEPDEKSSEMVESHELQEPPSQASSGDESDESEMVEHDVKVCDICGDAGREDLLAICSRCSDGAEHTYCMREMLQKLPEGEWLCEECKFAEETENQKIGSDSEGKKSKKFNPSMQSSGKRPAENIEIASSMKRQVIETSTGSQKSSSPTRTGMLSRDSSFKSVDKGKTKPATQPFDANQSNDDILETARSPRTGPRLQTPKSTLLKSNSFSTLNTKPKVKLVHEVVPQKQKGAKEHSSLDAKEGPARMMGKSMSFKSLGRSNGSDSKVKMLSPSFSHTHELKVSKRMKERSTFERKNSAKLDRSLECSTTSSIMTTPKVDQKLTPRGDTVSFSSALSNRESRGLHSEGKLSTSNKLARNRVEIPVASVGASSTNGIHSSEKKFNQISPKDEPSSSSSWPVERPSSNFNGNPEDGLPRSLESTNQAEKNREGPISHLRHPVISGSKGVPCQKCKEVGHTVDNCPTDSARVSGCDLSVARSSREEINKGNKVKAAINVVRNMPGFGKSRLDQSDGFSVTGMDFQCHLPVSNKLRNLSSIEGTHEVQGGFSTDSYKQATNNGKQLAVPSTETGYASTFGDSDGNVLSVAKQIVRDWSDNSLAAIPLLSKVSAIPEHEFIWQGLFEVHSGGKLPDLYGGIQAHLSTWASPKVHEAVDKFPRRIPLIEIPRMSTWPAQFRGSGAKEDHIALYFFAKDLESYENNYKGLVDNMIKNDLSLKGNVDGVELLIFASNQLPENCQRWNMLFFLWGVFRGRRESFSSSSKNSCINGLDIGSTDKDISSDVLSENYCSSKQGMKESSTNDNFCNMAMASKAPEKTGLTANGSGNNQISSLEQTYLGSEALPEARDTRLDSNIFPRISSTSMQLRPEVKFTSRSLEEHGRSICELEERSAPSVQPNGINSGSNGGEKMQFHLGASIVKVEDSPIKASPLGNQEVAVLNVNNCEEQMLARRDNDGNMVKLESNSEDDDQKKDAETSLLRDLNCWRTRDRKRPHLDLTEPQTSSGTSNETPWNEMGNTFTDVESVGKKLRTGFSEIYGGSSSRDRTCFRDGFASEVHDLRPGSSSGQRYDKACDERDIPKDLGSAERYFFPVGSQHAKGFQLENSSMPLKELSSEDEDQINDAVPSLELALGAERKLPNKGILPFFVEMADKNTNEGKPLDKAKVKEEEEDVSASLSLSLSFPFPDKERMLKPVSKKEQLLPERHSVNTSLLLFGGLPDK